MVARTSERKMVEMDQSSKTFRALNILAKWRQVFAGWQLGTRPIGDPECDAVRDHRELSLMMRVQLNVMNGLLIEKGVYTENEFLEYMEKEANEFNASLSKRFPGVTATESGLRLDPQKVQGWMKANNWRP